MVLANHLVPGLTSTVAVIMVMAVANVIVIILVDWSMLLYMNHISFTTPTSATFYVRAATGPLIVPVFGNIILGHLSTRFGAGRVHATCNIIVCAGLIVIAFIRSSRHIFLLGYLAYCLSFSFRILRISMLSDVVPRRFRTSILAIQQLCIPLGMIFGPVVWLIIQKWQGDFALPGGAVVDRFTLLYVLCAVIMFTCFLLAITRLADLSEEIKDVAMEEHVTGEEDERREQATLLEESPNKQNEMSTRAGRAGISYGAVRGERGRESDQLDPVLLDIQYSNGSTSQVNLDSYKRMRFVFYTLICLGVRLPTTIYVVAFQPIMLDVFKVTEQRISQIYLLVAILALLPPLLVTLLSHILKDRAIVVIALSLKTIGISLTLPIMGPVTEWQFVGGFILIAKGSMFFEPSLLSLFTKVLGRMCTGALLGWLWSISSIGPAALQLIMSEQIVSWFGGWGFVAFGLPALAVFAVVLTPYGWAMLDQDSELTRLVVRGVDRREMTKTKGKS